MQNIVRQIEVKNISSLNKIQFYFGIIIGLFGFTITLLGIKEKANCNEPGTIDLKEESLLKKHGTDVLSAFIFGFCSIFFLYILSLFLIYFFF